jgi:membrane associated rhomboid family serine protease
MSTSTSAFQKIQPPSAMKFLSKSDVFKIMVITFMVFTITHFIRVTFLIDGSSDTSVFDIMMYHLQLPANFSLWLKKPWCLFTYFFTDYTFTVLLLDIIWLWIFSTVVESKLGSCRILPIYIVGGIVGGLLYMLMGQFSLSGNQHLQASTIGMLPALMAVVIAAIGFAPRHIFQIYSIRVPLWLMALVFFGVKLSTLNSYNLQQFALIFGGVAVGLLFNFGGRELFTAFTYGLQKIAFAGSNSAFLQQKKINGVTTSLSLDSILEKIHQHGLNSLNEAEKEELKKYSET